jgi:hypothetical protein
MRKHSVSFGNFICTFGDRGGLLDFQNIVLPAFLTDTFVRKYGAAHYHFFNVKLVQLDQTGDVPVLALVGHLVKNTVLVREQIFDDGSGLVRDPKSMESSPSSYFVLILNSHRLIYFAETAFAPDFSAFASTAANFIKRILEARINSEHEDRKKKIPKTVIRKEFPRPTVQVVPISEPGLITDYLSRFSVVEQVRFRLIKPNKETDASEVIAAVRGRFGKLGPEQLDITVRDKSGLDKVEVASAVTEAGEGSNTGIVIIGEDADGTRLRGENENFAMTTELDDIPRTELEIQSALYNKYQNFISSGKIKIGKMGEHVADQIRHIATFL